MDSKDSKISRKRISRRELLKAGVKTGVAAGTLAGSGGVLASAKGEVKEDSTEMHFSINRLLKQASLSSTGGQRVVVVGGG